MNWLRFILGLEGPTFGAARSPEWRAVQQAYVRAHALCEFGMHKPSLLNPLNVHHVVPFHEDPAKELDPSNLIAVCRFHHFMHAHFGNWKDSNPNVRNEAQLFTDELRAHRAV